MPTTNLEICVDSVESAIIAEKSGAHRLELCSNLIIGGTTPSVGLMREVRNNVNIPVHVLIRPRFGDFCYNEAEYHIMKEDMIELLKAGANGVVIGALTPDGFLNINMMRDLCATARDSITNCTHASTDTHSSVHITLHRAFDVCADPFRTLEDAINLGIDTILTSGQKADCIDGLPLIQALFSKAAGRINIMPGCGVSSNNINLILKNIISKNSVLTIHMSAKKSEDSPMVFRRNQVPMGLDNLSEYTRIITNAEEIQKCLSIISKYK